jgi:hypothetical protein
VLVTGGYAPRYAPLNLVHVYDPDTNSWTREGNMPRARSGHASVQLESGEVMVLGGDSAAVDIYTPDTHQWSEGPSLPFEDAFSATLLPGGEVLALSRSGQAALYSPATHSWRLASPQLQAHAYDVATVPLPTGQVLVIGGTGAPSAVERFTLRDPGAQGEGTR